MKKKHLVLVAVSMVLVAVALLPAQSVKAANPLLPWLPPPPFVATGHSWTRTVITQPVNVNVGDETVQVANGGGCSTTYYYARFSLPKASMSDPPIVHFYYKPTAEDSNNPPRDPDWLPPGAYVQTDSGALPDANGQVLLRPGYQGVDVLLLLKYVSPECAGNPAYYKVWVGHNQNGLATIRMVAEE